MKNYVLKTKEKKMKLFLIKNNCCQNHKVNCKSQETKKIQKAD